MSRRPRGGETLGVRDAARRELIGLDVAVVAHSDPGLVGLTGRVVDESRRTFLVERTGKNEARVAKRDARFRFVFPEGAVVLDGGALEHAPEDRIKKSR